MLTLSPHIQAYKHPDSALATDTPPQFASKYGDPTHPSVTTSYAGRASAKLKGESLAERKARRRAEAMQSRGLGGTIRRFLPPVSLIGFFSLFLLRCFFLLECGG